MKVIDFFIIVISWLKIFISPLLLGLLIGGIIYISVAGTLGLILAISICSTGLLIGIIWATKVVMKKRATDYFNGLNATPDLDEQNNFNQK